MYIGLFCHIIGLFCHIIGLFCHVHRPLLLRNRPLLPSKQVSNAMTLRWQGLQGPVWGECSTRESEKRLRRRHLAHRHFLSPHVPIHLSPLRLVASVLRELARTRRAARMRHSRVIWGGEGERERDLLWYGVLILLCCVVWLSFFLCFFSPSSGDLLRAIRSEL